ncbi:MAG: PQQ-like beta-propeller repeat protein, partial [Pirellulaceae bacterium]|nr:PQQ-like beta-propeller repeat protein [Pirellulaceae bacterium]
KEGPKLLWQVNEIGDGYSTPAVVGERLYLISNQGMESEYVHALSTTDGKEVWKTGIGKVGPNQGPQYPGTRSTPTVEGDVLYALGSNGDLVCLKTADGKEQWRKDLRKDFGGKPGKWAYAESPLIDGEVLVVAPGGSQATIVALHKKSGDVVWESAIPEGDEAAYASAMIVEAGGVKQYVEFLGKGLVGVEAKTGKLLWRYEKTAQNSPANIPTPLVQDEFVYSAAGRSGGGLVQLKVTGSTVQADEVYFTPKLPTAIGGAVVLEGNLYGTNGQGLLCAVLKTGDIKWQERGVGAGSVCYADGRLYVHGENGEVALVEATPEAYREKGRFAPPSPPKKGPGKAWAYPVVANGRLYVREMGTIWCFDIKEDAGK